MTELVARRRDGTEFPVELSISVAPAWLVAVPVTRDATLGGVVELVAPPGWSADAEFLDLLLDLGRQFGQFLDRRGAETEARHRLRETTLLLETARRLTASLDVDVVVGEAARATSQLLDRHQGERALSIVYALDGKDIVELVRHDPHRGVSCHHVCFALDDHPGVSVAVREGRAMTARYADLPGRATRQATDAGFVAGAWAPIVTGQGVFGVVGCALRGGGRFDAGEVRILEGVARLTGLALGNAQAYRMVVEERERMAALEQTKARVLRVASHDLRTPLTVLSGYLGLIRDGAFGPVGGEMAESLEILDAKVTEMASMVSAMHDAALLEDHRLELRGRSLPGAGYGPSRRRQARRARPRGDPRPVQASHPGPAR